MIKYSFSPIKKYEKLTIVQDVQPDGTVWASSRNHIVKLQNGQIGEVAKFPFAFPRDLSGWLRPAARAFRADKCNVFCNSKGHLLAIRAGKVFTLEKDHLNPLLAIQGDCALHGGICEDNSGWTYFGEYFMNPKRGSVRIWRVSPAMDSGEIAYEFPAGSVRHVHGVFRDPWDPEALWAAVGDLQGECHYVRTHDRFRTIETFGDGSQIWRAVTLFFTRDHVCWLTDSNLEQNHACRMERKTGKLEIGQKIDNSSWYGTLTKEGVYLGFTTVERGPGIHRQESSILVSEDAFQWQEVHTFKKDFWRPVRLFKYGVISVPTGQMPLGDFWLSGEGLVGLDGCSLNVKILPSGCEV